MPSDPQGAILNVDDTEASRHYKSGILRQAGFVVHEVRNGVEALEFLAQSPPALMLLDVLLPGMDGFEVCRRVKADPRTEHVPVLHITAACLTDADWARGLEVGAETYLMEPVAPEVLIGTVRRVLHRRRVEDGLLRAQTRILTSLQSSEARYRALFMHAPYGIYTATLDGRVLTANRALTQILGYASVEAITAVNASAFYADPSARQPTVARWLAQGRVEAGEVLWQRQNGDPLTARLTGRVVAGTPPGEPTLEVFVEDVTEQRRLEAENRQTQKMDAVGRLATGIAHDFNNLLTAMLGYTDLMLEQIDPDKPIHEDLLQVHKAATSAAALTQQLLAFARKQTLRMQVIDLNTIVKASEHLIRRVIGEHVQVVVSLADEPLAVNADAVQLEQVLVNLAVNARDAMPDGGLLTIATLGVDVRDARHFPSRVKVIPGRYVRLTVADSGCGMDASTQAHLFEPFFTTKAAGRGTGLGLATIYGIVKQLGGYIWVSSELQQGSTFSIYLPSTDARIPSRTVDPVRPEVQVGRETILVVEDEPAVLALARTILTRHGYRVLDAPTPEAALEIARTQPFELILTDVVMPGMQGPTLVGRIRQERAGPLRAIYMSGYAADDAMSKVFGEGAAFLAKPFTHADLLRTVRQLLDAPPT